MAPPTNLDTWRTDNENQKYILLVHHDRWGSNYKSVGPFSSYESADKWYKDHKPKSFSGFLFKIVPITMPWKGGAIT